MQVRLVNITGTDVGAAVKFLDERVAPVMTQQKGFRQVAASGDRARGVIAVISVWDSYADLEASESAVAKLRQEGVGAFGGQATVAFFEQAVWEIVAPPEPGCVLQLVGYKSDPAKVDEHLAWFKGEALPAIMARPGIRAVRNLVNRDTGEGRVSVAYSDKAALDAAAGNRAQRMAEARSRGLEFGEDVVLEVLYGRTAATT